MKSILIGCLVTSFLACPALADDPRTSSASTQSPEAGRAEIARLSEELIAMLEHSSATKVSPQELQRLHDLYTLKLQRLNELKMRYQALIPLRTSTVSDTELKPMIRFQVTALQRAEALIAEKDPYKVLGIPERANEREVLKAHENLKTYLKSERAKTADSESADALNLAMVRVDAAQEILLADTTYYPKSVARQLLKRIGESPRDPVMVEIAHEMSQALESKSGSNVFSDPAFLDQVRFLGEDFDEADFQREHGHKTGLDLWLAEVGTRQRQTGSTLVPQLRSSNPDEILSAVRTVGEVMDLHNVLSDETRAAFILKAKDIDSGSRDHYLTESLSFLMWSASVMTTTSQNMDRFEQALKNLELDLASTFSERDLAPMLASMSEQHARIIILFTQGKDAARALGDSNGQIEMNKRINEVTNTFVNKISGTLRDPQRIAKAEKAIYLWLSKSDFGNQGARDVVRLSLDRAFASVHSNLTIATEASRAAGESQKSRLSIKEWFSVKVQALKRRSDNITGSPLLRQNQCREIFLK